MTKKSSKIIANRATGNVVGPLGFEPWTSRDVPTILFLPNYAYLSQVSFFLAVSQVRSFTFLFL
jgi:hypothetical protein